MLDREAGEEASKEGTQQGQACDPGTLSMRRTR